MRGAAGSWITSSSSVTTRDGYVVVEAARRAGEVAELAHPAIVDTLTQLIGPSVEAMQSMLLTKAEGKPGQAWHQDEWIALDDATVENGCLWAIPARTARGVDLLAHTDVGECARSAAAIGGYRLVVCGWRWLRGLPALVLDGVIAGAGALVTVWLSTSLPPPGSRPFDAFAVVLTALVWAPMAARRMAPLPMLVASCAAMVWLFAAGYAPAFAVVSVLLAVYTVAMSRGLTAAVVGAVLATATTAYTAVRYGASPAAAVTEAALVTGVVAFFGVGARRLADSNRRLADAAEQLRHEREQRAQLAVTRERVRIARELHDVVAHHMSVIAVQAGMARYVLPSDPATAGSALDTIGDTSREALDELRRILRLLRGNGFDADRDGSCDPAPGLARLGELVDRVRSAGVPVDVVVSGRVRVLPPGADLCVYRVVQESLTNVIKHARPASATVRLDYGVTELTVTVSDDGPGPAAGRDTGGNGLVGMRERARLYGGTLTAGAGPEGGFQVVLALPVGGYPVDARPGATRPDS